MLEAKSGTFFRKKMFFLFLSIYFNYKRLVREDELSWIVAIVSFSTYVRPWRWPEFCGVVSGKHFEHQVLSTIH